MLEENFAQAIAAISPEDLLGKVKTWLAEPDNGLAQGMLEWLGKLAKEDKEITDDELKTLRVVLFYLALKREYGAFDALCELLGRDSFKNSVKPDDWIISNLHRILGSVATKDNKDALQSLTTTEGLSQEVREQALLTIHFLWLEKVIVTNEVTEIYRFLINKALAAGHLEERMAMALALNGAVVSGAALRTEIAALLDAGFIGEQNEMITKAVQAIMTQGKRFREIYQHQHKGFFKKPEDEIPAIHQPVVENIPEIPGEAKPITRSAPKIGRNDPCPCGSGKKYKKCCGKNA